MGWSYFPNVGLRRRSTRFLYGVDRRIPLLRGAQDQGMTTELLARHHRRETTRPLQANNQNWTQRRCLLKHFFDERIEIDS